MHCTHLEPDIPGHSAITTSNLHAYVRGRTVKGWHGHSGAQIQAATSLGAILIHKDTCEKQPQQRTKAVSALNYFSNEPVA